MLQSLRQPSSSCVSIDPFNSWPSPEFMLVLPAPTLGAWGGLQTLTPQSHFHYRLLCFFSPSSLLLGCVARQPVCRSHEIIRNANGPGLRAQYAAAMMAAAEALKPNLVKPLALSVSHSQLGNTRPSRNSHRALTTGGASEKGLTG